MISPLCLPSGAAFLYLREIGYGGLRVAYYGSPNKSGYHLCAEFHVNALGLNFKVLRVFKVFRGELDALAVQYCCHFLLYGLCCLSRCIGKVLCVVGIDDGA